MLVFFWCFGLCDAVYVLGSKRCMRVPELRLCVGVCGGC